VGVEGTGRIAVVAEGLSDLETLGLGVPHSREVQSPYLCGLLRK